MYFWVYTTNGVSDIFNSDACFKKKKKMFLDALADHLDMLSVSD